MMERFALGAFALWLLGSAAGTPGATHVTPLSMAATDTVLCADTLRAADTIAGVVKLSVRPQDSVRKLPPSFETLFADEFQSRFKPPPELPLIVMKGDDPCTISKTTGICPGGTPIARVDAYAMVLPDGTIQKLSVISPSLNTELADSVRSVLVSMAEEKRIPFFESDQPLPLRLVVSTETAPDSVPSVRRLFRVKLPHYKSQFRQAAFRGGKPPRWPDSVDIALRKGLADSVAFEFTVLPEGRVASQSVDLVHYRHVVYVEAVVDALQKLVLTPATLGGCPVPQWAYQSFVFRPGRDLIIDLRDIH